MDDTQQCPNCGHVNDIGLAVCESCNSPMTAYGGQVTGEAYEGGRLKGQVAKLEVRPAAVTAIVVFDVLFALFWPFAYVIGGFLGVHGANSEGTNAMAAAVSWVPALFWAAVLVPSGIALLVLAWLAWSQRPIAWNVNLGVVILFGLLSLRAFPGPGFWIFLPVSIVLAALWLRSDTKAWYGMM